MKAPGSDSIKNIIYKKCSAVLTPHLLHIFHAVFHLNTYYPLWWDFTTVVLHKPGKAIYMVPKSYHSIALLNTMSKILTSIAMDRLTYILEQHNLLPNTHFSGQPDRSTTDSLHLLEVTIKHAWRNKWVASVLFLNIKGAFPNIVTDWLLHNIRKCKVLPKLIDFTQRVLTDRYTWLSFDSHLSD